MRDAFNPADGVVEVAETGDRRRERGIACSLVSRVSCLSLLPLPSGNGPVAQKGTRALAQPPGWAKARLIDDGPHPLAEANGNMSGPVARSRRQYGRTCWLKPTAIFTEATAIYKRRHSRDAPASPAYSGCSYFLNSRTSTSSPSLTTVPGFSGIRFSPKRA